MPAVILPAMPLAAKLSAELAKRYTMLPPLPKAQGNAVPAEAREAEVLITLGGLKTDAALIAGLPKLRLICCYGTGYEGVDLAAAAERGIAITHAAQSNAIAVAEFALGMMLATTRNMLAGDAYVRAGKWDNQSVDRVPLSLGVHGRRLGIYGMGSIGLEIAKRAAPFGMEIGYHNRRQQPDLPFAYHPTLRGLAEWADVLMVAVRASASTVKSVNAEIMEALGPDGTLVNISRGSVVDEDAIIVALQKGTIANAALDVFTAEPHVPEALRALPNVLLTPHIAALSVSAQAAQRQLVVDNIDALFAGRPLVSPIPV